MIYGITVNTIRTPRAPSKRLQKIVLYTLGMCFAALSIYVSNELLARVLFVLGFAALIGWAKRQLEEHNFEKIFSVHPYEADPARIQNLIKGSRMLLSQKLDVQRVTRRTICARLRAARRANRADIAWELEDMLEREAQIYALNKMRFESSCRLASKFGFEIEAQYLTTQEDVL